MLLILPKLGFGLAPMFPVLKPVPEGTQPAPGTEDWQAVVWAFTHGIDCVAVNIGLKLFRNDVVYGVLYLPTPPLIAVL